MVSLKIAGRDVLPFVIIEYHAAISFLLWQAQPPLHSISRCCGI